MKGAHQLPPRDKFAELLSQGLTTVEIRERMGISNSAAQGHMTRIRRDLGWQAK